MPVYRLNQQLIFPDPADAVQEGLLAFGGDLSPQRLLLAYSSGIFPWYNQGDPILWWSPDPRCILDPQQVVISRSLAKVLRQEKFQVTYDRAFAEVVEACALVRERQGEETWLTSEMQSAYCELHEMGFAHSVEAWQEGCLVGGLYGVCLNRFFFGESMFHRTTNASKVALATLAKDLAALDFEFIDCQLPTSHLKSLGAVDIPRAEFLGRLRRGGLHSALDPQPGRFPDARRVLAGV